ncbi:hypothetical protein C2845_PM03G03310 [Panicum miliaceum]|uniref:Uncharacterized protein n=1 Tax=Panicum miliaceum TaxID=4540 RepID=A0A3L6TCJ2_PANMI|nr:hypothetical protein C2845_PM03G03310 [Panicum miliaceum]
MKVEWMGRKTAKDLKNKGVAERGVTRQRRTTNTRRSLQPSGGSDGPKRSFPKGTSRSIRKMWKFQASLAALADFHKKRCAIEEERFGGGFSDREVPKFSFKEKPFGDEVAHGQELCRSSVVSLALFDGDCADIAIVTSINRLNVRPVHLDLQASPDCPDGHVLAAGRAFDSGSFMAMHGSLSNESPDIFLSDSEDFTEAALGGPLVGKDDRFHGMIVDLCHDGFENRKCAKFLSLKSLYERLELFQILNPKEIRLRDFSLPEGVSSVVPSGFLKTSYRLRSLGYPMPPPLVLEFNDRLHNRFEDTSGELRAWKGYPFGAPPKDYFKCVWKQLQKEVVTNISRRVVSLASFNNDYSRSFACTGLLIKWHGSRTTRTVVLTSANLVRSWGNEDEIDNLRCQERFQCYSTKDIFNGKKVSAKKVVAIGHDPIYGLLMAIMGEVKSSKKGVLNCKELRCSTSKIKKAGIGGPHIDFDGSFVGMNFYDGSDVTPFLPRHKVVNALKGVKNSRLPSESGVNPVRLDVIRGEEKNRWPVPKAYWYHGGLDEDVYKVHVRRGRTLL